MQKWVYLFVIYKYEKGEWSLEHLSDMNLLPELVGLDPEDLSNHLGGQGWKLVPYTHVITPIGLFKRLKS